MKYEKDAKMIGMHMGILEDDSEDSGMEGMVSPKENIINRTNVADNWNLGPEKTSVQPDGNPDYWAMMADRAGTHPEADQTAGN